MPELDLRPAADRMAALLAAVRDDALDAATPCADLRLAQLVEHIDAFARVFAAAARKELDESTGPPAGSLPGDLAADWRSTVTARLAALAEAWSVDDAWEGMTRVGGLDLPAPVAGGVALDELVVHGWDVARVTGQAYAVPDAELTAVEAIVVQFRAGNDGEVPGLFGPVVPVADDAPPLDRVLGLTGRDPGWAPA